MSRSLLEYRLKGQLDLGLVTGKFNCLYSATYFKLYKLHGTV
jgi:hypothetical protein